MSVHVSDDFSTEQGGEVDHHLTVTETMASGIPQTSAMIEAQLGALYETAVAAGDEQAQQHAIAAWHNTQALASTAQQLAVGVRSIAQLAHDLRIQRDLAAHEFTELRQAVNTVDLRNPEVFNMYENLSESAYDDAYSELTSNFDLMEELYNQIELPGMPFSDVVLLLDALFGLDDLEPHQLAALTAFINTLKPASQAGAA